MKSKVRYTDEPMQFRVIPDFLPPPDQLFLKEEVVKVTISLSTRSVEFFKAEAARHGVQYQRMIRRLLDKYVAAFDAGGGRASSKSAGGPRVEQNRSVYRKGRAPRK